MLELGSGKATWLTLELVARPPLDIRMPLILWLRVDPGTILGLLLVIGGVLELALRAGEDHTWGSVQLLQAPHLLLGLHQLRHVDQQLLLAHRIVVSGLKAHRVIQMVRELRWGQLLWKFLRALAQH